MAPFEVGLGPVRAGSCGDKSTGIYTLSLRNIIDGFPFAG